MALSGSATLIHELLWIRGLSLHFGTTTHAVATVVAAFMAGLALGQLWLGRLADRTTRPLRLYACLELVIAATGGALSLLMLQGAGPLAALARFCARAGQLSPLLMGAVLGLLMLVPATAMGGTLPVLARALARTRDAGSTLSTLYTCNTVGAIAGALLPDFVLIARYGHTVTAGIAAGCNALVALAVWRLARADPRLSTPPPSAAENGAPRFVRADAAAFLLSAGTGFCALSLEVLWTRTLQHWTAALVTSFAVLLATYLGAFACGTWLTTRAAVRSPRPMQVAALLLGVSASLTLLPVCLAPWWRDVERWLWPRDASLRRVGLFKEAVDALLHATFLEAGTCLALGAVFPFVAAAWLERGQPGTRSGQLFFVNVSAGVLGALFMGFVCLPRLGEQGSYSAVALLMAAVAVTCARLSSSRTSLRAGPGVALSVLNLGLVSCIVLMLPRGHLYGAHFRSGGELLAVEEGSTTTAAVAARYLYGEPHYVELLTPGVSMSSTRADARRYMAVMAHAAMFTARTPRRALLICYGVGNTAAALLSHASLERLDVVDIASEVLALAPWFAKLRGSDPLRDPRTRVFVDDGRHHLSTRSERYDVITAEPPPPNHAGVVNLYSREFYRLASQHLTPGGVITQWLPVFQLSDDDVRTMISAFVAELPHTALLYGHREHLILSGSRQPFAQLSAADLARRGADPGVLRNMVASYIRSPAALLGSTLQTDAELRRQVAGVEPLSDARPTIQYPYADVSARLSYTRQFRPDPKRAFTLAGEPRDPALRTEWVAAAGTTQDMLAALQRDPEDLEPLLQPGLDAHPDDEALWLWLGADRDRVTLARRALDRPGALELVSRAQVQLPRYLVLQDALWALARRAYHEHDYVSALTWLGEITPDEAHRQQHVRWTERARAAPAR